MGLIPTLIATLAGAWLAIITGLLLGKLIFGKIVKPTWNKKNERERLKQEWKEENSDLNAMIDAATLTPERAIQKLDKHFDTVKDMRRKLSHGFRCCIKEVDGQLYISDYDKYTTGLGGGR